PADGFGRGWQPGLTDLRRLAMVYSSERIADNVGREAAERVGYRNVVMKRLGHFLAAHHDHGVVHPVAGEGLGCGIGFGLGNLILMMGEDEIISAAMDVKSHPQILQGHRRALDVPARPSPSPRAVPVGLSGFGVFPHGKIRRMPLMLPGLDPRAGPQLPW